MAINGVSNGMSGYMKPHSTKVKNQNSEEVKKAEVGQVVSTKEEMSLKDYKIHFAKKMDELYVHSSQINLNEQISITDAAYERMKKDPEYEEEILYIFRQNFKHDFGSFIPVISVFKIDDTLAGSEAYAQGAKSTFSVSNDSQTQKSRKTSSKKEEDELLEYSEKMSLERANAQDLLEKAILDRENSKEIRSESLYEDILEKDYLNLKLIVESSMERRRLLEIATRCV